LEAKFELSMSVRDYECDLQGVVNNAVYMNYLEHARHEFLKTRGIDFAALSKAGTNLMVLRAELDYKESLCSGDTYTVTTFVEQRSRLKFVFVQEIINASSEKIVLKAEITGIAVNDKGKPFMTPELANHLVENKAM
jgi:acyl-CoA thioester hydrolase